MPSEAFTKVRMRSLNTVVSPAEGLALGLTEELGDWLPDGLNEADGDKDLLADRLWEAEILRLAEAETDGDWLLLGLALADGDCERDGLALTSPSSIKA